MTSKPKFAYKKDVGIEKFDESEIDRIALSIADRCLFITGGTGFLGKVLVEKLLRSCSDVKRIYLLIRPKKGKTPGERCKEMLNNVLFDKVKEQLGLDQILAKVEVVYGDIMLPGLGISAKDAEKLRNEVSLVYHCAATVRFDEPLREAVFMNVRGTKYMLDLAATFKNLNLFCYISTAYAHAAEKTLYEKAYDPPADPYAVMNICELLSDEDVASIERYMLGDIPNTYAYTKALAEALVVQKFDAMPATIFRPSIVIPIWREPIPGWTDNINGPSGLLIGMGKGIIRSLYCKNSGYGDLLPVDVAVNFMLVTTWRILTHGLGPINNRIIHITSSNDIIVSWAEIIEAGRWVIENEVPLNGVVWYPGGSLKTNYTVHWICQMLFQWLPAILVDFLLRIIGYPPVFMRVLRRVTKRLDVLQYYINNVWNFDTTNLVESRKLMNGRERLTYVIEKFDFDLIEYFINCTLCARRYILNESDETIPAAKRHMRRMWYVDRICKGLWLFGLSLLLYRHFLSGYF